MKSNACIAVLATLLAASLAPAQDQVNWAADFRAACEMAAEQRRLVLLHFYNDNCAPCLRVDKNVFSQREVGEAIAQNYVPLKVHAGKSPQLVSRYRVDRWPTDVFVTPSGLEVHRAISAQKPAEYIALLEQVAARSGVAAGRQWSSPLVPAPQFAQRPASAVQQTAAAADAASQQAVAQANGATEQPLAQWGAAVSQFKAASDQSRAGLTSALEQSRGALLQAADQSRSTFQQAADQSRSTFQQAAEQSQAAMNQAAGQAAGAAQGLAQQSAGQTQAWSQQAQSAIQSYEAQAGDAYRRFQEQAGQTAADARQQWSAAQQQAQSTAQQFTRDAQDQSRQWQQTLSQAKSGFRSAFVPFEPTAAAGGIAAPPTQPPLSATGRPAMSGTMSSLAASGPAAGTLPAESPQPAAGATTAAPSKKAFSITSPPAPTENPWFAGRQSLAPAPQAADTPAANAAPPLAAPAATPAPTMPEMPRQPEMPALPGADAPRTGSLAMGASPHPAAASAPPTSPASLTASPRAARSETPPQAAQLGPNTRLVPASQAPPIALDGFCPVTLVETVLRNPQDRSAWKKGDPQFGAVHRGRTYLFTSAEQQQKFLQRPDAYAPMFSGYDPVRYAERGEIVEGKRAYGLLTPDQRLFLFADEASYNKFNQSPGNYISAARQAMLGSDAATKYR